MVTRSIVEEQRAFVQTIVTQAQARGLYGSVVIKMEAGRIVRVETTEIQIPPGTRPPKSA